MSSKVRGRLDSRRRARRLIRRSSGYIGASIRPRSDGAPGGGRRVPLPDVIRLRTGTVRRAREVHPGLLEAVVEVEGREEHALAYPALTGPVPEGSTVLLNTTAVSSGLGTGGYHFVV